jgi:HTH DNA binding domain
LFKVVIEIPRSHLAEMRGSDLVESISIIQLLKFDRTSFAGICRLKPRDGNDLKKLVGVFGMTRVESLAKEGDGSHIAYVEGKPMSNWIAPNPAEEGYQAPPFELTSTSWRKTLVGSEGQVRRSLKKFERGGLKFKVVWSGQARFEPRNMVSSLPAAQRRTLSAAYRLGYFDFPRRVKSRDLAKTMGLSKATVSEHLRRAEKSILEQVFAD